MVKLGVNIDHVATVRQARRGAEPDPVWAAAEAELGGADLITVHLREDRRHIQDRDVELLRKTVTIPLNLEMAGVEEMLAMALKLRPDMVTLVPEKRSEVTTEGGLDVAAHQAWLSEALRKLHDGGIRCSAFIDAAEHQVQAAATAGFDICELHTGPYALAGNRAEVELQTLRVAAAAVLEHGMQLNAGHGLNYTNVEGVAALERLSELHIGHAIISRALFAGLREAVRQMRMRIESGRSAYPEK